MKYLILASISVLSVFVFGGCEKEDMPEDPIAGSYQVSGIQIATVYPCWPCTFGEKPTIDTIQQESTVLIERVRSSKDSLRFYGLLITAHQEGPDCQNNYPPCGVFGTLDGNQFQIHELTSSGKYDCEGTIKGDSIFIHSSNSYRNRTRVLQMVGVKKDK